MKDIQTQREDMLDDKSELLPLIKTCYYQFIANWKWFLLSVAVCLVAGWFYQQRQSRVYHRDAVMLIEDAENSASGVPSTRRGRRSVNAAMELGGISVGDTLEELLTIIKDADLETYGINRDLFTGFYGIDAICKGMPPVDQQ